MVSRAIVELSDSVELNTCLVGRLPFAYLLTLEKQKICGSDWPLGGGVHEFELLHDRARGYAARL
ncbi:hypothetical protein BH20ACI3_BH20ACI3_37720 [soil metagenome]